MIRRVALIVAVMVGNGPRSRCAALLEPVLGINWTRSSVRVTVHWPPAVQLNHDLATLPSHH